MSLSRARTRFAAIAAAVPVLIAGSPLVAPALADHAPGVGDAAMVKTLGDYRIGPRAGFRGDVERGVNGSTAVMTVHVSPGTVINSLQVRVSMDRAFSIYQHFNSNDGFALYKDANANGRLDAAEYAAGAVTYPGYSVTGDNGAAVVTLTADPGKATGAGEYVVAVHPAQNFAADRKVSLTIPANGVATSAGTIPSADFAARELVIDSAGPALIPLENFTAVSRPPLAFCPPGSPVGACGDDGYRVHRGTAPAEPEAKLGFFNAAGDVSDAALLVAKPAAGETPAVPAVYQLSGIPAAASDAIELSIGNGTGRDPSVAGSKALNNQLSDTVYAVQWDQMGNLTTQAPLTNDNPCAEGSSGCVSQPMRGNDVTGVKPQTSFTVAMGNINTSSNAAAHPVTASVNGEDSARPANRTQASAGQIRHVAVLHRLSDQGESLFAGEQAWAAPITPTGSSQNTAALVNAASNENYPSPSKVRATSVLVDKAGNPSAPAFTPVPRYRDLVAPKFTTISLLDNNNDGDVDATDNNGAPDAGETYRIVFDDALDTTKVTSSNINDRLDPDNVAGAGKCNPTTADSLPCPYWGDAPGVAWSTDGRVLTVTLGDPGCKDQPNPTGNPHPTAPKTCRLAAAGDEVTADISVTDLAGNQIADPLRTTIISNPYVQEIQYETRDLTANVGPAVFGTGRDGIIEAVDVTFSGPVDKSTIATASERNEFSVQVPGGQKLAATATGLGGGSTATVVRLSFTPPADEAALWNTAATPLVEFSGTDSLKSGSQLILPFKQVAADGAPPVPVSIKTADTATTDGRLDRVFVKYSEAIKPLAENECGYSVAGYGDSAYVPPSSNGVTKNACPGGTGIPPRNAFTTVAGQPDTVALILKSGTAFDTHAAPLVSFSSTNQVPSYDPGTGPNGTDAPACNPNASLTSASIPDCGVLDSRGNALPAFSGVAVDGAFPAIVGRATGDADSDGRIDHIAVTFSEGVSTPSVGNAQFQVTEPAYTIDSVTQAGDTVVKVTLVPGTERFGDTAVRPKLQYLGGITDAPVAGTPVNATPADAAGVVVTDKAGPAIMGACVAITVPADTTPAEKAARLGKCPEGAGDKMAVTFSEPLDTTSGVVAAGDFVVEQPNGTVKTVGSVGVSGAVATLTMAPNNNLDGTKDAFVKLAAVGAVNDNAAAPKNASTQTALIAAWAAPTVSLKLSCPVASKPGYCAGDYIETGAAGSAAVTAWRLVDAAVAPPVPSAGDFSATQPNRYPASGSVEEGPHTLRLRGKDDFDRISAEAVESITVLKAPEIRAFQMVNSATPRVSGSWSRNSTLRDGDSVRIGAEAYGTDAAEWAANNAPIGGGCLSEHMSINVKDLTGVSTHTAVAPIQCDLTTTTAPPHRQMQFPVVRVAGTTRYPVGTVVKTTTSDPGSMIVDAPDGGQLRRPFISVSARRSWMITDASVIKVASTVLSTLPKGANIGYRDGALLRTGSGYYYVENGVKRPVSSTQLSAWRMSKTTAYSPTSTELKRMPTGRRITGAAHAPGTWIKYSDGRTYQIVKNAQGTTVRRKLASRSALRTLVPTSHIYAANSSDSRLPVDTWLRGYRDGTVLKVTGGYAVVARGSLRKFANAATFYTLGFATSNALTANGLAMPRESGKSYRLGEAIDRYKITSSVIKVTNKAGVSTTMIVSPTYNGLYGVGTLDPAPAGWDFTR